MAKAYVTSKITEYDSTLPAQFNANGDNLAQYQVYGNTGGVGDRTDNILDMDDVQIGYWGSNVSSWLIAYSVNYRSTRTAVSAGIYTFWFSRPVNIVRIKVGSTWIYDGNNPAPEYQNITSLTVSANEATDIGISVRRAESTSTPWGDTLISLTEGSTASYVPYGYEVGMAVGSNILQSSEIEQGGYYASAGMVPQKMANPTRCRSKNIYTISCEKIFYDFKSINGNIAFVDHNGISLGGAGFKTGRGAVDVPANAVKCFFIIANSDASDYINPAQVISAGIWAIVDITVTPIYIGDDPLGEDEYVDFKEQKVYRMVNGVLTPTDPPVALPALPTCEGTTIVDYVGQSVAVPSRFYAKYNSWSGWGDCKAHVRKNGVWTEVAESIRHSGAWVPQT